MSESGTRLVASDRRFPIGLTLAVALLLPVLIGLGLWQVQRLKWKEALLAEVAAAKSAPARPLERVLARAAASGRGAQFAKAWADCPGLASARYVQLQTIVDGQPGVRLISPCPTPEGTLLVDRGFVAAEVSARPPVGASDQPLRVVGVLRHSERPGPFTPPPRDGHFYGRDIGAMAAALKAPQPLPYMLVAQTPSNPDWRALTPVSLPDNIPNNHLGYALTWFGLAAALTGVYAGVLVSRRRRAGVTPP